MRMDEGVKISIIDYCWWDSYTLQRIVLGLIDLQVPPNLTDCNIICQKQHCPLFRRLIIKCCDKSSGTMFRRHNNDYDNNNNNKARWVACPSKSPAGWSWGIPPRLIVALPLIASFPLSHSWFSGQALVIHSLLILAAGRHAHLHTHTHTHTHTHIHTHTHMRWKYKQSCIMYLEDRGIKASE